MDKRTQLQQVVWSGKPPFPQAKTLCLYPESEEAGGQSSRNHPLHVKAYLLYGCSNQDGVASAQRQTHTALGQSKGSRDTLTLLLAKMQEQLNGGKLAFSTNDTEAIGHL